MRAEMRTSPRLRETGGRLDGPYEPRPANARRAANLKELDKRMRRAAPTREDRLRQAMLRMGGQVQIGVGVNGKGVGFFVSIPLPHSA